MVLPRLGIVVLNYDGSEDTIECLESPVGIGIQPDYIVGVDNGPRDKSMDLMEGRFPGVRVVRNSENLGYAEGNNVGIEHVIAGGAEFVLLLNNDVIVDETTISPILKEISISPEIGISLTSRGQVQR